MSTTPSCPNCHRNSNWSIGREFTEYKDWDSKKETMEVTSMECTNSWITCDNCGYEANWTEDKILWKLLENK